MYTAMVVVDSGDVDGNKIKYITGMQTFQQVEYE